mmetsp:Transcript_25173/g.51400  ORF Transcript_25173/g.51400 Transcript_25173/m.51400 type:complete len:108 (-) Transcript_25173:275-598(-)
MEGYVEAFATVEVEHEKRDDAILTIYDDGREIDRVVFSEFRSIGDMYNFLVEKGLARIEPELEEAIMAVRYAEKRAEEEKDRIEKEGFIERRRKDHEIRIARGEVIE